MSMARHRKHAMAAGHELAEAKRKIKTLEKRVAELEKERVEARQSERVAA